MEIDDLVHGLVTQDRGEFSSRCSPRRQNKFTCFGFFMPGDATHCRLSLLTRRQREGGRERGREEGGRPIKSMTSLACAKKSAKLAFK